MTNTATTYNSAAHVTTRATFLATIEAARVAGDTATLATIAEALVWNAPHASALFGTAEGLTERDVTFVGQVRLS